MKATKKILSLVLALMMVLSSVAALADGTCPKGFDHANLTDEQKRVETTYPDCLTDGKKDTYCAGCGALVKSETLTAPGHTPGEAVKVPGTCTTDGYWYKTCANANCPTPDKILVKRMDPNDTASGHDNGTRVYAKDHKEPTCQEAGYIHYTQVCGKCGEGIGGEEKAVDALTHHWDLYFTYDDDGNCTGFASESDMKTDEDKILLNSLETDIKYPTCTTDGKYIVTCPTCGVSVEKPYKSQGHNYVQAYEKDDDGNFILVGDEKVPLKKDPTCLVPGYKVEECSYCHDTRTTTIATPGNDNAHNFNYADPVKHYFIDGVEVDKPADCVTYTVKIECKDCGELSDGEVVEAKKAHVWGEKPVVDGKPAATCTEDGVGLYRCTKCGAYSDWLPVEKLGHEKNEATKKTTPSTCVEDGLNTWDCTRCKEKAIIKEVIPATGHSTRTETVEPKKVNGVIVPGYEVEICTKCGEEISRKELLHTPKAGTLKIDNESSCTVAGSQTYTCALCGEKITESLPLKQHSWKTGVVKQQQTCGKPEITGSQCSVCGTWDEDTLKETAGKPALEHTPYKLIGNEYKLVEKYAYQAPTCTTPGFERYNCARCGELVEETLDAKHDFVVTKIDNEYVLKCKVCGHVENYEAVPATYEVSLEKVTVGATTSGKGSIKLIDGNAVEDDLFVRVYWTFELSNGDIASIAQTRPVAEDGTFKMNGPRVTGGKLTSVQVHLVTDEDADQNPTFDWLAKATK